MSEVVIFFLGLALAIPLSILANLSTGPTERALSRFSERRRESLKLRFKVQHNAARWFAGHPLVFALLLQQATSRLVYRSLISLSGIGMLIYGLVFGFDSTDDLQTWAAIVAMSLGVIAATAGAIGAVRIVIQINMLTFTVRHLTGWPINIVWLSNNFGECFGDEGPLGKQVAEETSSGKADELEKTEQVSDRVNTKRP